MSYIKSRSNSLNINGLLYSLPEIIPRIRRESIHIWDVYLDIPPRCVNELCLIMSEDELARMDRFYFESDRLRFAARRGLLRIILGRYLDVDPAAIRFQVAPGGKPYLQHPSNSAAVSFNTSHSNGWAVFAFFSQRRVGIDVEEIRCLPDAEQIASKVLSPRERGSLRLAPPWDVDRRFLQYWTAKEAFVKATGEGLTRDIGGVEIDLTLGSRPGLLSLDGDQLDASRWRLIDIRTIPGFVAALVAEGHDWVTWNWRLVPSRK